jgi:hypothetical protein
VDVDVGFVDVLLYELVGTVEETFDVLSGVIWDQNAEVLDVRVDEQALLSEYWHNRSDLVLPQLLIILSQLHISQE